MPRSIRRGSRNTLAPRQQLLKLKANIAYASAAETTVSGVLCFRLQSPYSIVADSETLRMIPMYPAQTNYVRGWDAYRDLYNEYQVRGVKVKVEFTGRPTSTSDNLGGTQVGFLTSPETLGNTGAILLPDYGSLPLGLSKAVADYSTCYYKKYISLSSLFGHNTRFNNSTRFDWASTGDSVPTNANLGSFWVAWQRHPDGVTASSHYRCLLNVQMTYYVSAQQVNTLITADSGLAAAVARKRAMEGAKESSSKEVRTSDPPEENEDEAL